MKIKAKITMLLCTFLCVFLLCSCDNNLSMEEQAWNEAVTYITWFADKNDAVLNQEYIVKVV